MQYSYRGMKTTMRNSVKTPITLRTYIHVLVGSKLSFTSFGGLLKLYD
jgi:hypothetical protein